MRPKMLRGNQLVGVVLACWALCGSWCASQYVKHDSEFATTFGTVRLSGNPPGVALKDDFDGWREVRPPPPFSPRTGHATVYFHDYVIVIGGEEVSEGRALLSDVWSSRNGYEWAKATHSSPWAARRDHSLVLAGGPCGDSWRSVNGVDWELQSARNCSSPQACSGHGTCTPGNGSCSCDVGWAGSNCSDCDIGYFGEFCWPCAGLITLPNGTRTPCSGHGTCDGSGTRTGFGLCSCQPDWSGSLTCSNCTDFHTGSQCEDCLQGFWGSSCLPCPGYDVFTQQPCSGHGNCSGSGTQGGSGKCTCEPEWDGDGSCGVCTLGKAGPTCEDCANNYWGYNCTSCPGFMPFVSAACNGHGVCNGSGTTAGNGSCICEGHFTGEACADCQNGYWGPDCDACPGSNASTVCSGHGQCSETDGCVCWQGFTGMDCSEIVSTPARPFWRRPVVLSGIGGGALLVVLILSVLVLRGRRKSGIEQKNGLSDSQFSQFLLNSAEETSMEEAERDASLFFAKGDEKASR